MKERELLSRIADRSADLARAFGHVLVGPGDDCAVVAGQPHPLLLTTDHLVQHRHFNDDLRLELVARKAILRSVSDIAAMAGTPSWALATALLPVGYAHANELFDHMARFAREFGCPLVGGDIASLPPESNGPISLTVTVGGHAARPILRSGARAGDHVYVTGALGGSLRNHRHALAQPRIEIAQQLADRLHAMIDLSDGLGVDAGRVARASGVGIELDAHAIPIHPDAQGLSAAIGDGEDYELLFTSAHDLRGQVDGVTVTRIGRVVTGQPGAFVMMPDGSTQDVTNQGFEHG
ncbi:MAG: thiamine-phosphate kinase [Phycisphaerales bacterium]